MLKIQFYLKKLYAKFYLLINGINRKSFDKVILMTDKEAKEYRDYLKSLSKNQIIKIALGLLKDKRQLEINNFKTQNFIQDKKITNK